MSDCTRSRRCRFAVLYFKSWAYSRIYGQFHQHRTARAQKRLFMNFRCKFRHRRSIPRPRFAYSLYNFYWAPTTIKGRLLSSRPMLKSFSVEKIQSRRNGPQKWKFVGKMGVKTLDIGFATPKRHFLARNRVVWRILRQNQWARLGGSLFQKPPEKNSRVTLCRGARNHACAEPKPLNRFG